MHVNSSDPVSHRGGPEHFVGDVWRDELARPDEHSRISINRMHFAPGARSDWHQHPLGQVIHVTEGVGLIQERGGEVRIMRAGETVVSPPGEWHWHGASATSMMTMLGIQETHADEPLVCWGEPVSDEEYGA